MKYFEILYYDCFNNKYVALKCGENIEEVKTNFSTFNGCRMIDYKETDFESYRKNTIKHFIEFGFSTK